MRVRNRILNTSEEIALKELSSIAAENGLRVFPKLRLSDAIDNNTYLDPDDFSYYTRSHFDFLITTPEAKPFMAVEYDGPFHCNPAQIARDTRKNFICKEAELPILRINANHVFRKYRGMTLLRWIIEVMQLKESFTDAQEKGEIPFDEPFDPFMIVADGSGKNWSYWLSVTAKIQIKEFLRETRETTAWFTLLGQDDNRNLHSLAYIRVGDHILYVRTSVRNQDADIDQFGLILEVTDCEMAEQLSSFLVGDYQPISIKRFQPYHDSVCQKYKMHVTQRMGSGLDASEHPLFF
jgi:hypothetical protein